MTDEVRAAKSVGRSMSGRMSSETRETAMALYTGLHGSVTGGRYRGIGPTWAPADFGDPGRSTGRGC